MTAFFSKQKRSRFILVLAMTFLLSVCLCFITACDDDSSSDVNNPTTVKTDNCAIANGNFEYYTDDNRLGLIVSPSSWTKSNGQDGSGNSAGNSTRASGIVDTGSENWTDLTESKNPFEIAEGANLRSVMRNAANQWDSMSTYDRLHFYKDLEDAVEEYNDSNDADLSLSDFEKYNEYVYSISADDIPDCENPGTHGGSEDETGVLMIHNYRSDGLGTAQRYTSSTTVSLAANTSARISVWVKTQNLTYDNGTDAEGTARGANISVTHTVGGRSLDQMQIKNINTEGVTENNGWVQYTVYVKACPYASSTFTIVLGLGQGSSTDAYEYLEGYAFFDDVDMDVISNEAYDEATKDASGAYAVPSCTMRSSANEKKFETNARYANDFVYALDLYQNLENINVSSDVTVTTDLTATVVNNTAYTTSNYQNLNISTQNDIAEQTTWNGLNGRTADNRYLGRIWADDFDSEKYPFDKDESVIFLMSAHGAAYTAKMDASGNLFTLGRNEYRLISFWVKTSDTSGYTGATATLYDESNTATLGAYNTTTMSTVDLDDREDIYDGWVQCFFFVGNTSFSEKSFRLEFSYGPTTITGTSRSDFSEGYAAFTGFSYCNLTKTEYENYAGTASQGTTVSLQGRDPASTAGGFDSVSTTGEQTMENTLANLSNYWGVNGGSRWTSTDGTENEATNSNANAGLLNKNYIDAYRSGNADWFTNLARAAGVNLTASLTDIELWNALFGNSTQPLLISNVVEQSYGYIAKNNSNLSANGYSAVSVRVKVSAGAKAYIYLVDTSDLLKGYDSMNELNTVNATYWYDDEGNVCLSDPADNDFNPKTDTAFYRAENGLFRNNLDESDTNVYANLANYGKDDDGNLIADVDANGNPKVSYDYSDDYSDDGIAFYLNASDGKYYAYYNADNGEYSTEVKDFGDVTVNGKNFTKEYARYISVNYLEENGWTDSELGANVTVNGKTNTDTYITVDGGTRENPSDAAGKWITVTFYVRTGSSSFPYRLEVFSGSRDGQVKSAAGSYVMFDAGNSADVSSNYDNLISEAIDDMTDGNGYIDSRLNERVYLERDEDSGRLIYADRTENGANAGKIYENAQYYAYTFYDDPGFRRYDRSLDENDNGNPYGNYTQSDNAETLTYLYHESELTDDEMNYCMFLNYAPVHQNVLADDGVEIDEEEETENRWWEDADFWLMLSSVILAVVLIIVLLIMLTMKLFKKFGKKNAKSDNRYNAKRMHYIRKLNLNADEEENEENQEQSSESSEEKGTDENEDPYRN